MAIEHVVVEADGGSRGNPGPAGYGAVVLDPGSGEVLAEASESIGTATNNVAEYGGLIAGLERAAALGARRVSVRMDSKLVVEQMKGAWKIKNEGLRPLALRAQELRRGFESVDFTWIPRAQNARADRLANEAMDRAAGRTPRSTSVRRSFSSSGEAEPVAAPGSAPPAPATTVATPTTASAPATTAPAAQRVAGSWSPPSLRRTRFVLVRHGSTVHSAAKRFSGRNDLALDDNGRAQAAALARRDLGEVAAVVSSPLRRTLETAGAIATPRELDVEAVEDLVETDFGAWEGRTFAEVLDADPDALAAWRESVDVAPPGGESFAAVGARVERARLALTQHFTGASVLVVAHVTPIKLLLGTALQAREAALYRIHLDTASVSIVDFYPDGNASVSLVNDTSHLR